MARYLEELANYYFTLVHKPETANHADKFSQWLNHDNRATDNEDVIVLGPELHILKTLEECISMPLIFPEPVMVLTSIPLHIV